jgi:uncharacterized damage-inducible protein DinB
MRKLTLLPLLLAAAIPAFSQDIKATVLKHLATSRDFTIKVAEAMPESDYDFKLTPPQMSFAGQIVHLSQGFDYFLSPMMGEKPSPAKPKSMAKADVVAFVRVSFDRASERISALTPEQIAKTYKSDEGSMAGVDLLLGLLDHTTHHRASAEMYLRAKGITPPEYQF